MAIQMLKNLWSFVKLVDFFVLLFLVLIAVLMRIFSDEMTRYVLIDRRLFKISRMHNVRNKDDSCFEKC